MCTPRPRGTLSAETNFNSTLPSNTTLFPSLAGNHTVVGPNSRSRHLFTPQIHHRALGQVLPLLSNFDRNRDLNHVAPPQQRPTTTLHSLQTHPFPLQTREYFTAQESASWKERHKHPPDRTQQGNPLLTNRYPLPATCYPLPATRYPRPATRDPADVSDEADIADMEAQESDESYWNYGQHEMPTTGARGSPRTPLPPPLLPKTHSPSYGSTPPLSTYITLYSQTGCR